MGIGRSSYERMYAYNRLRRETENMGDIKKYLYLKKKIRTLDEWSADYNVAVWLVSSECLVELCCECDSFLKILVHLPVAGYNFLSHVLVVFK